MPQVYYANQHPNFPKGGKMSQYLDSLKVGDAITVKGPVSMGMGIVKGPVREPGHRQSKGCLGGLAGYALPYPGGHRLVLSADVLGIPSRPFLVQRPDLPFPIQRPHPGRLPCS